MSQAGKHDRVHEHVLDLVERLGRGARIPPQRQLPTHSPAFLFERVSRDQRRRAVECVRSVYRGDRCRLETELLPSRGRLAEAASPDGAGGMTTACRHRCLRGPPRWIPQTLRPGTTALGQGRPLESEPRHGPPALSSPDDRASSALGG